MALPQRRTDIGPPHFKDYLPPVIQKNYGDWAHHEILSGGVMVHVANSGDKIGAVKLTQEIYGSTLSEALAFVEKLQSGG